MTVKLKKPYTQAANTISVHSAQRIDIKKQRWAMRRNVSLRMKS